MADDLPIIDDMTAQELSDASDDSQSQAMIDLHEKAMRRFDAAVLPQLPGRELALRARRFASIPGAQWEGEWGEAFENAPKLEINKVAAGLEKIERDFRANRIEPDFRPAGGEGDQETADTLDGMYRADAYRFKSSQAMDNAFSEGSSGGMGAYRLLNVLDDPYDPDNDSQRINPASIIVDADQRVFFDPNSKLYDKSDARYAFVLTAVATDAFEDDWDCKAPTSWPEGVWRSQYNWFQPDIALVCEYYEATDKPEKLWVFTHETTSARETVWAVDLEDGDIEDRNARGWVGEEKRRNRRRVRKYTLSATAVLKDHGYIAGPNIPVVPYYGKRWFIDNVERFKGDVQDQMDMQRSWNVAMSKLAEIDALSSREMPIFAPEQMPPEVSRHWADMSRNRNAYALALPLYGPDGQIAAIGPTGTVPTPKVPEVTAAVLQIMQQGFADRNSDPDQVASNVSAEAMDLAATRVDAKSGIYLDNWQQTVQRGGEIYLGMAGEIYVEEGREVETMTEDGDDGVAKLMELTTDKQGVFKMRNDFTAGRFKVIASITEATATRRDKTVKAMTHIASVLAPIDPASAKVALNFAVLNMDGEGIDDYKKFTRKEMVASGALEPNDEEKAEMEQQAQQQQPDPTQQLIAAKVVESQATAQDKQASAALKGAQAQKAQADTVEAMASAQLKGAQATAVGGPEAAPQAPSGLEQAGQVIDFAHKAAQIRHLDEQTRLMPEEQAIEAHRAETQRLQARRAISARGGEL